MRLLSIFLLSSFSLFGQLQPILWHVKSDTIERWNYHFGDEFSTTTLDNEKWYGTYSWGGLLAKYRIIVSAFDPSPEPKIAVLIGFQQAFNRLLIGF